MSQDHVLSPLSPPSPRPTRVGAVPASATGTFGVRAGIVIEPGMGCKIGTDVTYT